MVCTEECLAELVDDTRATELRERIARGRGRDDRAVRQRVSRPVMVGDDDLETATSCFGDLLGGRDAAVDGQQ